ncbi:glycerate kinase [Maribacter aestuarii]|uniref:glycerate kinase n=1 Tax=Maribacter aestuarii TaxID=1130723 RepID=UPI0025A609E6|nr:glycerate kinase [Maribacter aestuarii]
MKFVLAPDKYKGSLSGAEFCNAVEEGILKVLPKATILKKPLADGGDGTIAVVKHYLNADTISVQVNDPLFRVIDSGYLLSHDSKTAFIEMSEASGLKLLHSGELNCMETTSFGTGELILDALEKGVAKIILGIGGSATNDGGMGIAAALGYEFLDKDGNVLKPIGKNLKAVATICKNLVYKKLSQVKVKVACDVSNPFYGNNGAAFVYGPQKGASEKEVKLLDEGLKNFADCIHAEFNVDVQDIPGAGAAGGVGGGAIVFLNATLTSGIDLIKELADFDKVIYGADWIITGEGKLDAQTLSGKTIAGVLTAAHKKNIKVAALCGAVELTPEQQEEIGLHYVCSILRGVSSLEDALGNSYDNLVTASYNFAKLLKKGL